MSPEYKYYLTIGTERLFPIIPEIEVNPGGDWELEIKLAEEDFPFCKDYRIKCGGEFIFSGEDYDNIINVDCCNKLELRITCDGKDYWIGYFSWPFDLEVDEDLCTITGTPKPLDKYYYFDQFADEPNTSLTRSTTFQYNMNFPTPPPGDTWYGACLPCELLWDVITEIGTTLPCEPSGFTYTVKSTFFQNDLFPDGTNPYPTDNYVTGFTNKLNNIVMAMTQDVCSQETVVADLEDMPEWSWNDIMEILHNMFNVWWYIDEAGEIRIEHIYFWELYFGSAYDLTTLDDGYWLMNSNKYSYRTNEIPTVEQWLFSDNQHLTRARIIYSCITPGIVWVEKDYSLTDLTTNIEYIAPGTNNFATSPLPDCSIIESSDFMFIRCISRVDAVAAGYAPIVGCPWCAWFSRDIESGNDHVNAHLWGINLLVNYWMHDRPLWQGSIQGTGVPTVTFESVQKNLLQRDIVFPTCCDSEAELVISGIVGTRPRYLYDFHIPDGTIITQYGDGDVSDGTIKNGMFSGTLMFEDTCLGGGEPTEWSDASEL